MIPGLIRKVLFNSQTFWGFPDTFPLPILHLTQLCSEDMLWVENVLHVFNQDGEKMGALGGSSWHGYHRDLRCTVDQSCVTVKRKAKATDTRLVTQVLYAEEDNLAYSADTRYSCVFWKIWRLIQAVGFLAGPRQRGIMFRY